MATTIDTSELDVKVKNMYRHVAEEPGGAFHFELGRALAERLGYPGDVLDRVPAGAIDSFAGVAQENAYRAAIEGAGLRIEEIRENPYDFISDRALRASEKYGVKSVSLLATKA